MKKPPAALICVAVIRGAFGVRGEVRVQSLTEHPERCFGYGPLLDEAGRVVLTVTAHRPLKKGFAARAEEIASPEAADALKGVELYVRRDALPAPEADEVYAGDLIGLAVRHVDGRSLGHVRRVYDFGGGETLEIEGADGPWMLPFARAFVPEMTGDTLIVDPPEGLEPGTESA